MAQRPEQFPPNGRRLLAVAAAATVAAAALLAFTGEGEPGVRDRTEASGRVDPSGTVATSDPEDASGVVRARGGGGRGDAQATTAPRTGSPATTAPTDPRTPGPGSPPPDELDELRSTVAAEMRERLGPLATTPEGEEAIDEAVGLVEDGESVDDAIEDVLGPPGNSRDGGVPILGR